MELNGVGGGQRRASQIAELIRRAGFEVAPVRLDCCPGFRRQALSGLAAAVRAGLGVSRGGAVAGAAYRATMAAHPGPKVLVRERTLGFGRMAADAAHATGFRTLALPQNFESLVAGQEDPLVRFRSRDAAVAAELRMLAREDKVFCIAREEQWLLTAHGIPADHLPYFPTAEWEADLLRVRAARRPAAPRRFVVIGSVSNPPVRAGVLEILRRAAPAVARAGAELHVAGNSTELIAREVAATGVVLHGRLPDHDLDALLGSATAALVFQTWGCGALTKLPELLLAGVPVIANGIAARSAHHYLGVYLFETDEELAELIRADLPTPPPPPRPTQAENRFISTLRTMAGDGDR
jgi:glycosyltransferase involved in cell wall biosynthesis